MQLTLLVARGSCSPTAGSASPVTGGTDGHWDYDCSLTAINRASFSLEPVIRANKGMAFDLVELSLAACLRI